MIEKGDIVMMKGSPEPFGVVRKFLHDGKVVVDWWPTPTKPQHATFLSGGRLEVVERREKRGRPKKNDF